MAHPLRRRWHRRGLKPVREPEENRNAVRVVIPAVRLVAEAGIVVTGRGNQRVLSPGFASYPLHEIPERVCGIGVRLQHRDHLIMRLLDQERREFRGIHCRAGLVIGKVMRRVVRRGENHEKHGFPVLRRFFKQLLRVAEGPLVTHTPDTHFGFREPALDFRRANHLVKPVERERAVQFPPVFGAGREEDRPVTRPPEREDVRERELLMPIAALRNRRKRGIVKEPLKRHEGAIPDRNPLMGDVARLHGAGERPQGVVGLRVVGVKFVPPHRFHESKDHVRLLRVAGHGNRILRQRILQRAFCRFRIRKSQFTKTRRGSPLQFKRLLILRRHIKRLSAVRHGGVHKRNRGNGEILKPEREFSEAPAHGDTKQHREKHGDQCDRGLRTPELRYPGVEERRNEKRNASRDRDHREIRHHGPVRKDGLRDRRRIVLQEPKDDG